MKVIRAIVAKEVKLFFSDRRAVVMGIITPIVLASFFGYLFGNSDSREQARIPVLVADLDGSAVSKAVVAGLTSDAMLEVRAAPEAEARETVKRGKAPAAILLPEGFGDAAVRGFFGGGRPPEVGFLVDPSRSLETGLVRGLLSEKIAREAAREAFSGQGGRRALEDALQKLGASTGPETADKKALQEMLRSVLRFRTASETPKGSSANGTVPAPVKGPGESSPFTLRVEPVTEKKGVVYDSWAHSYAGIGIQFLLFTALDFGIAFLLERQGGLWKRLRAAPLARRTLLFGKMLAGAAIGLVSVGATWLFGIAVFRIRVQGSLPGFFLVLIASALMASAFGLLLAALGKTPGATRGLSILAVLVLVLLGGGWVPMFVFPKALQQATLVLPTRWAIDGLDAMTWRGAGFSGALAPVAVLLGWAGLFFAVAWARFRWNEG